MQDRIRFTKPQLGSEERNAVLRALDTGAIGGNGPITGELQQRLRAMLGVRHALFTTSCTHALELAAMAINLKPGDEVIMPSFTFVTTATSVIRSGAKPVFVDIEPDTCNLDVNEVARAITPATRAIIPVHYSGYGCAMDELCALALERDIYVIEDAAQGFGAYYKQQPLGTIGHAGCFSFHVTKNVVGGEGGAFVTNDDAIASRAELIREKGTNRAQFLRGEVDKYTWIALGSSFVQSDLIAAIILAQLEKVHQMHAQRRQIWEYYHTALRPLARQEKLILPLTDPSRQINWHLFAIRTMTPEQRDPVLQALVQRGIDATFHFIPLHSSPYGQKHYGYRPHDLPITEQVAASLIRLPIYPSLTRAEQDFIIEGLYDILGS
jgi:dTDP-4-amino-4,6-dideoxygalactose transaminase